MRIREPNRARPYRSPFGIPGAVVAIAISWFVLFTIVYTGAKDKDFRASLVAAAIYFLLGGAYYVVSVRPSLGATQLTAPDSAKMNQSLLTPTMTGKQHEYQEKV
ncbi:hypothetical protein ATCC90586_010792 [Pythium insidiosum]|nr:hypothetical protein ATCC90586_010792 [Pythium insidiosum]